MSESATREHPSHSHPALLPLGCALGALLVSLVAHSPRLWMFAHVVPGSTYWDRGLQFMLQAEHPLSAELVDPGLVWRLAPAGFAWLLGLHGYAALLVPWLGLVVMLTLAAHVVLSRSGDRWLAAAITTLLATTSATLTVTGWLGMNDAWYATALLAVAFVPSRVALGAAVLIGPWIDERFTLALPLALWVRSRSLGPDWQPRFSIGCAGFAVLFYLGIRFTNPLGIPTAAADKLLQALIGGAWREWMPLLSLGWFMGLRAAWLPVLAAIAGEGRTGGLRAAFWPSALALGAMGAITFLAADTGRATTMLLPLLFLGFETIVTRHGLNYARRLALWLVAANLAMPAMHVTNRNADMINMLPLEILRWVRQN